MHGLVLDGVYQNAEGEPVFREARAPIREELQGLLARSITRLMKMLTRRSYLIEEEGLRYTRGWGKRWLEMPILPDLSQ